MPVVTNPQINPRLAQAVEARRKELQISPGEFVKRTGLTAPALRNLRQGHVRQYQERLTAEVCRVLRWTPDSIDRLLDGDDPIPLDDDPQPAPMIDQATIDAIIQGATSLWEPALETLQAMNDRLARIEALLGLRAPKPRGPRGSGAAEQ